MDAEIFGPLAEYCRLKQYATFHLVADHNTYPILGRAVEDCLNSFGGQVRLTIIEGTPIIAAGDTILQLLTQVETLPQIFIAIGSGTITDVVRFTSFHLGRPFISIPTAPSVDAYTSMASPLIVSGVKQSFQGQIPEAIFIHTPTLENAPADMIAAGFGDMLGKYTALADWRLGHMLWGEPYSEEIAAHSWQDLSNCIAHRQAIAARKPEGIRALMESLLDSGLNMARQGSSRPASGAEHHLSHVWEMRLLWNNRSPILHGVKVGIATLYAADLYAQLRQVDRWQVESWAASAALPDAGQSIREIRQLYTFGQDRIIAEQSRFLNLTASEWEKLKHKVLSHWDEIQSTASTIPPRPELEAYLKDLHFPLRAADLGLTGEDIRLGLAGAHYLRDRLTVMKLLYLLNIR